MLSAHDLLNNAKEELRKQLLDLLGHVSNANALANELGPKRFAVWAIAENILKPLLARIGTQISITLPLLYRYDLHQKAPRLDAIVKEYMSLLPIHYEFNRIAKQIELWLKIPKDWIKAEEKMPNKQQSLVRINAGRVLLVYEQLKKWTTMFNFNTAYKAARKNLAEELLDNEINEVEYRFLQKAQDAKMQRLPKEFGELIYDDIQFEKLTDEKEG